MLKIFDSGVDAIVVEGFEAGGHNGKNETTTMCLVPLISKKLIFQQLRRWNFLWKINASSLSLGADGVQIGSRLQFQKNLLHISILKIKLLEAVRVILF